MTLQPCVPCESAPFRRWGEVELHIVSLAGRELTSVVIDTNSIVADLKDRIEKSKQFPLDKSVQSLVFDGRNLRNADVLESYGTGPGHVFNLGHGITPDIDPEHLGVLVDAVHELSPQYHK